MLQLQSEHGYVLTFTPQSNEFTITMPSSSTAGRTAGLCGNIRANPSHLCWRLSKRKCSQLPLTFCSPCIFLLGACIEDTFNVLSLRNGSSTTDQPAFVSDWTVGVDGGVCLPKRKAVCASGAAMGCQALRSEVFEPCHAHIPVQVFLAKCEEQTCEESDVCELISTYARLCRQSGVCVDWRTPHLCRMSPSDAFFTSRLLYLPET